MALGWHFSELVFVLYEVLHVIRHFPLNFIVLRPRNSSSLLLPCFAIRLGPLFQNLSPYVPLGTVRKWVCPQVSGEQWGQASP